MRPDSWHEVSPSRYDWEREALAWLREHLPDHEPWRAWSNFEFAAEDGSANEVDLLVVGRTGIYLVEVKSQAGRVSGDQGELVFTTEDRRRATLRHPRWAANLKAKRLASLLRHSAALRGQRLPFIDAVIFLSNAVGFDSVSPTARAGLFLRDRDPVNRVGGGILAAILDRKGDPQCSGLHPQLDGIVDRPLARKVERALEEIGIRRQRERQFAGDYELTEILDETTVFRDFLGRHRTLTDDLRRVRRYFVPRGGSLQAAQIDEAAEREAALLRRLEHDAILRATHFSRDEQGPILFLEHLVGGQPLDAWLAERAGSLTIDGRTRLLRVIAEAVQYAHSRQIVHRCLSPRSILVAGEPDGNLRVKVMNWQAGALDGSSTGGASILLATLHPEEYHDRAASAYLAPELRTEPQTTDPTVDVFSLGTIAYLLLTGQPPAESREGLLERLRADLRPSSVVDGMHQSADRLVARAAAGEVAKRLASVEEFLEGLSVFEKELDRSFESEEPCSNPPDARVGQRIGPDLVVLERLGSGSTAIGFRVRQGGDEHGPRFILKLARDPKHSQAVRREGEILSKLDHQHIVKLAEHVAIGDYAGLLLLPANNRTLRRVLDEEGSLHLELLERYGGQLLDALAHLERVGVSHRDIKPDNIAVTDFDRKVKYGIVLFDFSLSGAPADQINVGTPAYTDHFLSERPRKRWDTAAERFSAAVTLYEMATGSRPVWGDGRSDPAATQGEAKLDGNLFPAGVRQQLLTFFKRSLARVASSRFDSAESMREAWDAAFHDTSITPLTDASTDLATRLDSLLTQGPKTPLIDLPLSTRAQNVLERLSLHTVEQLLRIVPNRLLRARGVGSKTRDELGELMRLLRVRFTGITIDVGSEATPAPAAAVVPEPEAQARTDWSTAPVSELASALIESIRASRTGRRIAEAILGLEPSTQEPRTQSEVASAVGVSRQRVAQVLPNLRASWAALPAVQAVALWLHDLVGRQGGVITFREAADQLHADRGGGLDAGTNGPFARALVRAAIEGEEAEPTPRWILRRRDDRLLVAKSDDHVAYADMLAARAAGLARQQPLPDPAIVERELGVVPRPASVEDLSAKRRVDLAAAVAGLAVSARRELYPVGMPGGDALALSANLLLGAGRPDSPFSPSRRNVTIAEISERVRSRYPEAGPLPARPALDELLASLGFSLRWDESTASYDMPVREHVSVQSRSTSIMRGATVTPRAVPRTLEEADAVRFETRVRAAIEGRRFLVVKTSVRDMRRTEAELLRRFPQLIPIDLDRQVADTVDAILAERRIKPEVFFDAFAAGESRPEQWLKVMGVMQEAASRVKASMLASPDPALVLNVGLLAQLGLLGPIESLNSLATNQTIRSAIVLIPGDTSLADAIIDGRVIFTIGESQRIAVPDAWLRNDHRAA